MRTLTCDGDRECRDPVAMIDEKGFVYCADHGVARRNGGRCRCRKLTAGEKRTLESGEPIPYTRRKPSPVTTCGRCGETYPDPDGYADCPCRDGVYP